MTPRGGLRPDNPGGRPPKDPSGPTKGFSCRLPPRTIEAIKEGAQRLGISQADLIDVAIGAYLTSHPGDPSV